MRIPSGDLAPARRRRRSHSKLPVVIAVVLVVAIAALAYVLRRDDAGTVTPAATRTCRTQAPPAAPVAKPLTPVKLPAPSQVSLRLLNGNGKDLLARAVGNELAKRGFHVTATGNAPRPLAGPSRVYFGPGGRPAALLVSAHVSGSSVVPVPSAGRGAIDVVLGSAFVRLRTAPETSAYARELASGHLPLTVASSPKPLPSPTCR